MIECEPNSIVLVRFPFTDLSSTKKRPALVLSPRQYSEQYGDVVLMPLTSQPQKDSLLALAEWKATGLPKPTWVKPLVGTLSIDLVERVLGSLSPKDFHVVSRALDKVLAPAWRQQV